VEAGLVPHIDLVGTGAGAAALFALSRRLVDPEVEAEREGPPGRPLEQRPAVEGVGRAVEMGGHVGSAEPPVAVAGDEGQRRPAGGQGVEQAAHVGHQALDPGEVELRQRAAGSDIGRPPPGPRLRPAPDGQP
jgi:hypothetical protein